jgi:CubicO group peptidase (beta-lactamase class C family)
VLLSLYGSGRFGLDDDINRYLPFPARNPAYPDSAITFRQLLIHRSSIADNGDYYRPLWSKAGGDNTIPRATILRQYRAPVGKNYSKEKDARERNPLRPARHAGNRLVRT